MCATTKADSMVGRALSGWPDVRSGGLAPGIDCFPPADRNSFRMFSMHLFDGCSLNEELSNVLTAVLLLHMSDMQRLVPISVVLAKMNLFSTSEKLGEWEEAIKSWYINRNGTYLLLFRMRECRNTVSKPSRSSSYNAHM